MINVFLDASVLFAAAYSANGSARDLVSLALDQKVVAVVSNHVLEEAKRNLSLDYPAKAAYLELIAAEIPLKLVDNPTKQEVLAAAEYTVLKDAIVVAAAQKASVDYFVTYDRKHLLNPKQVAERSGLKIVTPDFVVTLINSEN